jgi:hypothetical protein
MKKAQFTGTGTVPVSARAGAGTGVRAESLYNRTWIINSTFVLLATQHCARVYLPYYVNLRFFERMRSLPSHTYHLRIPYQYIIKCYNSSI